MQMDEHNNSVDAALGAYLNVHLGMPGAAFEAAQAYLGQDEFSGLLLCGPRGTGKTSAAVALLKSQHWGGEWLFVTAEQFYASTVRRSAWGRKRFMETCRSAAILILDDIVTTQSSPVYWSSLKTVLWQRRQRRKTFRDATIVTVDFPLTTFRDLTADADTNPGLIDGVLRQGYQIVDCTGEQQ